MGTKNKGNKQKRLTNIGDINLTILILRISNSLNASIKNQRLLQCLLWYNRIGGVSGAPRHRFDHWPGTVDYRSGIATICIVGHSCGSKMIPGPGAPCAAGRKPKKKKKKLAIVNMDLKKKRPNQIFSIRNLLYFIFLIFFYFFAFLGSHPWHMEVPSLGVESELQPPAYATAIEKPDPSCVFDLHHNSQQCQILNPLRQGQRSNLHPDGYQSDLFPLSHDGNSQEIYFKYKDILVAQWL